MLSRNVYICSPTHPKPEGNGGARWRAAFAWKKGRWGRGGRSGSFLWPSNTPTCNSSRPIQNITIRQPHSSNRPAWPEGGAASSWFELYLVLLRREALVRVKQGSCLLSGNQSSDSFPFCLWGQEERVETAVPFPGAGGACWWLLSICGSWHFKCG